MEPALFFGVGTGRCGTMAVANALNAEPGVTCTHEGKFRRREQPGEQLLRFLTLENRLAYEDPSQAGALFDSRRGEMPDVARARGTRHFGDIAYNYAPFVDAMGKRFPDAKLIVFVRHGVDFVRSAVQASGVDEAPVGWPPAGKDLSPVERFIELGRLAPRAGSALEDRWAGLDYVARNAWLWAETNRLIFDALERRPAENTFLLRFEEFFADPGRHYARLRAFLGLTGEPPAEALHVFATPINPRREKPLGPFATWSEPQRQAFCEFAMPMMERLGFTP